MIDHRPLAHLLPRSGWTNDPIGPVHWRGRTHLFNQVNPAGPYWDRPHWGHFVTDDLVHWQHREIALSPDADGPDADGCYSGCITVVDDTATMFYTGARGRAPDQVQTTCVARSTDEHLDVWIKEPTNPVTSAPDGVAPDAFRDPFVFRDGDRWLQMVGVALPGVGGAVMLYTSPDLVSWELLGPMLTAADLPGDLWTGEMWECPALLRTPNGDALLISVHDGADATYHAAAIVGSFQGDRFEARNVHRFDHGPDLYAPCLHIAPDGRAIVWGWSWEARSAQRQQESEWAGVLTLPREVSVVDDEVTMVPLPEIDRLRASERTFTRTATPDGWLATGAEGDALDLHLTVQRAVDTVALRIRRSPDGTEHTEIGFDLSAGQVWLDRDAASLDDQALGGRYEAPVPRPDGPVEIRVIVDRSIVEVFVADHVALTARVYPTAPDSTGIEVVGAQDGAVDLRVWELGSVWGQEPTVAPAALIG